MTAYVRFNADGAIDRHLDLTTEQYASLQANGKAAWLRLWIVEAEPVPTATQVVVPGPIIISATEARQTWTIRDKTAAELEAESVAAELAKADEILADLSTQRAVTRTTWDAYTASQLRSEQWRDRQALLRAAHFLIRRAKLQ